MPIGSVAAATDDEKRDDKEPDPVVVEKTAKAVIHKNILHGIGIIDLRIGFLTIILCRRGESVRAFCRFLPLRKENFLKNSCTQSNIMIK